MNKKANYSAVKSFVLSIILVLSFLSVSQVAAACPTGMQAYWKGEDNGQDSSGNGNTLSLNSVSFANGKLNRAFSFDGINNYMIDGTGLNPGNNNEVTLETWIRYMPTPDETQWGIIIGKGRDWHVYGVYFLAVSNTGLLQFAISDGQEPSWMANVASNTPLIQDTWYHVVAVGKQIGSNYEMSIYINGTLDHAVNMTRFPLTTSATVWVGRDPRMQVEYKGLLDEIAIYNRALTLQEIQLHYNHSNGMDYCTGIPPEPQPEVCNNGIDDDQDGLTDCADTVDCAADPSCQAPPEPIGCPSGMISYWKGEGNANDVKGLNPGTAQDGLTYTAGRVGQAFTFNGADASVFMGNPDSLKFANAPLTIEAWVYPIATNEIHGSLITKENYYDGGNGVWNGYGLVLSYPGPLSLTAMVCSSSPAVGRAAATNTNVLSQNTWNHVVWMWKTNGDIEIYINGQSKSLNKVGLPYTGPINTNYNFYLGRQDASQYPRFFQGKLDEVAVYNRELTVQEITAHYNGGTGKDYCAGAPPENLIYNATGGTVEDQGITVTIPPGALGTTELLVDIVESVHSFAPTIGITNVSPLLDIGPQCTDIEDESTCGETNGCRWNELAMCESIPFLSPVTIAMPGDCSGTYGDLTSQKIAKYNVISGTPEPVSTCDPEDIGGGIYSCQEGDGRIMTWNTNTCMISVQTWSFSTYSVIFFLDDDNDGIWNINDDCKANAGIKEFNGCNAALSVKAENHTKVTVGKTTTSIKLPLAGLQVEVYDMQCVKNAKLTPAAKDFDKIRSTCPVVVKKTTDSTGALFLGVNANKAYILIGVLNGKTNSQLGTPTDTILEGQILEKKLQYLTVPDITKMPPLNFLFDAIESGNFLVLVVTVAVAFGLGYYFGSALKGRAGPKNARKARKRKR